MGLERAVVLLVEDNPDDLFLFQEAFKSVGVKARLVAVGSGEEAIAYLSGSGAPDRPRPDVIFLDVKLVARSGFEVLEHLRGQQPATYPVVLMMSSSADPRDIERAYGLRANAYLLKPSTFDELLELLKAVDRIWFRPGMFLK